MSEVTQPDFGKSESIDCSVKGLREVVWMSWTAFGSGEDEIAFYVAVTDSLSFVQLFCLMCLQNSDGLGI